MESMTNDTGKAKDYSCGCGATQFTARAALFRVICHCTICQRFNQAPYADILVFRRDDLLIDSLDTIAFDTYKPPPNVNRGVCNTCAKPALELFEPRFLPKLAMIPGAVHQLAPADTPAVSAHIFYDKRVADVDDELPKFSGFFRSQMAFMRMLMKHR